MPRKKRKNSKPPPEVFVWRKNYIITTRVVSLLNKNLNFVTKCRDEPFLRSQSAETT